MTSKTPTTRKCTKCNEEKLLSQFRRDSRKAHGVTHTCRPCRTKTDRANGYLEQAALYRSVERAKRAGVLSLLIIEDVHEIKSATSCAYCQCEIDRQTGELDHVLPMALGFENIPGNVVHACVSCNRRKQERGIYEFMVTSDPGNLGHDKFTAFCELFATKNGAPGNGQAVAESFITEYIRQGAKPKRQKQAAL